MPVCIAGMHRSGTSMITRMLNLCGLTLGPARHLLRARPSNPEGFWENRSFIRVNEALLAELGGTWDEPPRLLPAGWQADAVLESLAARARKVLRPFRRCEPWGWKDPRGCITFPFWQRLLPDLRGLLCVRNPLAVAESLRVRDAMTRPVALDLWLTYNRHALQSLPSARWVITHCDSYFRDPQAELRRVLTLLDLPFRSRDIEQACASIRPALLHHRADDLGSDTPCEVRSCYRDLCRLADIASEHASPQENVQQALYKERAAG